METALPKENRTMAITDALFRVTYRIVYPIWRLYLRVIGSRTQGAQVAVWYDSEVLLVRNSYRDTYTFPGGYRRQGEPTALTAGRELHEETGIRVAAGELDFSFAWTYSCGRLEGHDDIYEYHAERPPRLAIDHREVVEAGFFAPVSALQLALESHVRDYLETRTETGTRPHITCC
ncbi:MAG: NUDIX hydrolase [Gammaproteobacteria bacterium]|nr:NUDIX hydrolase [Gammaproteobacteria bacterium]MDH3559486.1 NUDIX hydrolase [Gammaproteobacteria bacterium]